MDITRTLLKKRSRTLSPAQREARAAYFFIAPSLIFFTVFQAVPILSVIVLTFTKYNLFSPPKLIGLKNYVKLFSDQRFLTSLSNTVMITALYVVLLVTLGLLIALGIHSLALKGLRSIFRTVYFIPMMTSFAAVSVVWKYLLQNDWGIINYYLRQFGLAPVPWITHVNWALISVVLVTVWKSIGFDFVILLAALQQTPRVYAEAAMIDGANAWQRFRHITLPMISSSIFFCVVINFIDGLQIFDVPKILTNGGPGDATQTLVMYLYEVGFRYFEMGYGSTISLFLLVVILIITLLQFALSRRWVYYEFDR